MSLPKILVVGGLNYTKENYPHVAKILDELCEAKGWVSEVDKTGNSLPEVHLVTCADHNGGFLAYDWAIVRWCHATELFEDELDIVGLNPDLIVVFPGMSKERVDMFRFPGNEVIEVPE